MSELTTRTRDIAAQVYKLAFPCAKRTCKCAGLCAECQAGFDDAAGWVCDYTKTVPTLSLLMKGGQAKAATAIDRAYACMQVQQAHGLDQIPREGGVGLVDGWWTAPGAGRRVIKNEYGAAYVDAKGRMDEEARVGAASGDSAAHFQLKKEIFATLCRKHLPDFEFEEGPCALARLQDLPGPQGTTRLHAMQDFLLFTVAMELTTRLETKVARMCSADDLETWLGLPCCRPVLRGANFFSFHASGAITYEIFNDKISNKADPSGIGLARVSFDVAERAPVLFSVLPGWRLLAQAAQKNLGFIETSEHINCATNAPYLYFDALEVPLGEPNLPLAHPRKKCRDCCAPAAEFCPGCHKKRHKDISGVLSRRLSKIQEDNSTPEQRIAATGAARGHLGCNSFRHTRMTHDCGVFVTDPVYVQMCTAIHSAAVKHRTTPEMLLGVYVDRVPEAQKRKEVPAASERPRRRRATVGVWRGKHVRLDTGVWRGKHVRFDNDIVV